MPLGTNSNSDVFVGNPFQAPLNMSLLLADNSVNTNFKSDVVYIWDPNINTRGAYVTVNLPSGSNASNSAANKYLMPGQAAFFKTKNSGAASLVLSNQYIENTNRVSTFREEMNFSELKMQLFSADSINPVITDGLLLLFNEGYNSEFDQDDASKTENLDENLSVKEGMNRYSIVKQNYRMNTDTLNLSVLRYRGLKYKAVFKPLQLKYLDFFLWDRELDSFIVIDAVNQTEYDFEVGGTGLSREDRFAIIVKSDGTYSNSISLTNGGIKVYPNPSNGRFFVSGLNQNNNHFATENPAYLELNDITGKKVKFQYLQTAQGLEIELLNPASGMYFLNIQGKVYPLIIQN
jgi:hypothetical protein